MSGRPDAFVFIHPSDELYGADRMMIEILAALPRDTPAQVWLPTDLQHPDAPLCAQLQRRGITVRHLDLPVLRRAYRNPRGLAGLGRRASLLVRELRAVRHATVYCTTSAALLAAPLARVSGAHRVVGHVQEIWTQSDRRALTWAARSCHRLLAISRAVAQSLPASLQARTTVVPNATSDPATHVPLAGRTGPLRYVVASRWNAWKGHQTLLSAWDRLDAPGHLVVLGGPPASGEAVDVRALAAGLRRPESVSVIGEVSDPGPFLDDADVVLMPSDKAEPFGLVAIEAFARARPVIGTAAGGLLDVVTPGTDGWLVAPGDAAALADLLAGLDRPGVTAAGTRARETYERRFSSAQFGTRWRDALCIPDGR
ncbi:MAG: glycosyltransferase family 4 protein [Jatrophihabitantaceae bacterium]